MEQEASGKRLFNEFKDKAKRRFTPFEASANINDGMLVRAHVTYSTSKTKTPGISLTTGPSPETREVHKDDQIDAQDSCSSLVRKAPSTKILAEPPEDCLSNILWGERKSNPAQSSSHGALAMWRILKTESVYPRPRRERLICRQFESNTRQKPYDTL